VRLKPPRARLRILRWCPPCSLEAVSEVKTHMEAKLHMYYFVLH
jgi:hypothetical protein